MFFECPMHTIYDTYGTEIFNWMEAIIAYLLQSKDKIVVRRTDLQEHKEQSLFSFAQCKRMSSSSITLISESCNAKSAADFRFAYHNSFH